MSLRGQEKGRGILKRLWAALRGDTAFGHLKAGDHWATWQRSHDDLEAEGRKPHGGRLGDRRD